MGKNDDTRLRTAHPFMIKKIIDDKDEEGGARLIGTFVQMVYDLTEEQVKKTVDEQKAFFQYRVNEVTAPEEQVHVRRTESLMEGDKPIGARSTIEVDIPLEIDSLVSCFPFQIYLATATIELSSTYSDDGKTTLRPDILVHKEEPRQNISIQNKKQDDTIKSQFQETPEFNEMEDALDKMDKSKKYNLLTPWPEVFYEYDPKKKYCPRFVVQFYLVDPGFYKLVSTLLPMILVWFVSILNVWNDFSQRPDGEETANHLQVTSALTLTIVFVLPEIVNSDTNRDKLFSRENLNIITFFVALILASVPYSLTKSIVPELVGVVVMGIALLLPVYHAGLFSGYQQKMRAKKFNKFLKDKSYKPEKNIENYRTLGDMLEKGDFKKQFFKANGNRLWWNNCEEKCEGESKQQEGV